MDSLAQYEIDGLERLLVQRGFKPSHAQRVLRSYYIQGGAIAWEGLKAPVGLKELLEKEAPSFVSEVAARQVAADGTTKVLLKLQDGKKVEAVMMTDHREDRVSGCLSSQAGCAMGCDFCATAKGGLERNLTSGEIVEQFLRLRAEALSLGRNLKTLVFMGMGEPMHNLDAVLAALRRIAGGELGALGWRQTTVSTVGIVPGINKLAAQDLRVNLAISLHAPDDETRARILPTGKRYEIGEILEATDRYMTVSGLPAIIQYCLLKDVNDSLEQAAKLAAVLNGRRMHVNLLNYNPTGPGLSGKMYEASSVEQSEAFMAVLREKRVIAHFRRPRGRDIDAACGQLAGRQKVARTIPGPQACDDL